MCVAAVTDPGPLPSYAQWLVDHGRAPEGHTAHHFSRKLAALRLLYNDSYFVKELGPTNLLAGPGAARACYYDNGSGAIETADTADAKGEKRDNGLLARTLGFEGEHC
jgi:hypothetical protein